MANINEFFKNDIKKISELKKEIEGMDVQGINKKIAKDNLVTYLDRVIEKLKKENI